VAALLAMTIVPAVLVLISGSQIIRDSAARWFSEPVDDVLAAAQLIATTYYQEAQEGVALRARRLGRVLPPTAAAAGDTASLTPLVEDELRTMRDGMVEVYRAIAEPGLAPDVALVIAAGAANLPPDHALPSADRLAARVVGQGVEVSQKDDLDGVSRGQPAHSDQRHVVGAVPG
jgi:nitrogen fixation/metabolism regulation signal transduction histidine kinase